MKIDRYIIAAGLLVLAALSLYVYEFHWFDVSDDPEDWGQLGDYVGGILNPILSFISVILIVRTISLQREANDSLQSQISSAQKNEVIRGFESKFFGMIKIQAENFSALRVVFEDGVSMTSVDAVFELESRLEVLRDKGFDDDQIGVYIENLDQRDQLFGLLRGFYVTVKFIIEGLSEERGFSTEERRAEINTLINFTDFALVRLCKIMMQFTDSYSATYLNSCDELSAVFDEVGLSAVSY